MKKETTIYIKGKDSPQGKRVGVVRPTKRRSLLERRTRAGINFYDLGAVSTGPLPSQFTQLDYGPIVPSFASGSDYGSPDSGSTSAYANINGPSGYAGLLSKIFEVPVSEWRGYYKKVTPAMNYNTAIARTSISTLLPVEAENLSDDNPRFTDNGLVLPEHYFAEDSVIQVAAPMGVETGGEFLTLRFWLATSGVAGNKVTTEYDIDADAVEFTASNNMDVFLLPSLNFIGGWCRLVNGTTTYNDQHLNDFWITFPRGILLDSGHELAGFRYSLSFNVNAGNNNLPPEGLLNSVLPYNNTLYQRGLQITEWMKTLPSARGTYREGISNIDPFTFTDDGSTFNTGAPSSVNSDVNYYSAYVVPANFNLIYLRAVVIKGGVTYYFWNSGWA